MSHQRIGKYACLEVEVRYLLRSTPEDLPDAAHGWLITDRYFPDTHLRLRHMQSASGEENIYKLTQKYRSEAQDSYEATITNLYLSEKEYQLLGSLEAKVLQKRRYPYSFGNRTLSIDVFEGHHQGLVLAEMELEHREEMDLIALPAFVLKEVTEDPFFTGGSLSAMTDEGFRQGLAQRLGSRDSL